MQELLPIKKLVFSIFILTTSHSFAKVTYVNHFLSQFAGEIGLVSVGLGKNISEKYNLAFYYGIVPEAVSKANTIETFAFKQTYDFYDFDRSRFYIGLTIYHALGLNYQTSKYGVSPDGYYPIGSIRGLIFLGSSILTNTSSKTSMYFEAGVNDIWITNFLNYHEEVSLMEMASLALGIKKEF